MARMVAHRRMSGPEPLVGSNVCGCAVGGAELHVGTPLQGSVIAALSRSSTPENEMQGPLTADFDGKHRLAAHRLWLKDVLKAHPLNSHPDVDGTKRAAKVELGGGQVVGCVSAWSCESRHEGSGHRAAATARGTA
eukprot:6212964-Pleurochrysis_carterae.AAC.2